MRTFKELKKAAKTAPSADKSTNVALLGDSSTQLLSTAIIGEANLRKMRFEIFESDYNQIDRQILDPTSDYHVFKPDFTIIFHSTHKFLEIFSNEPVSERKNCAINRLEDIKKLISHCDGKVIICNYPEIDDAIFGNYANKIADSFIFQVRKINLAIMEMAQANPNLFVCDIQSIQSKLGRSKIFDTNIYIGTDMVLSLDSLPYIASSIVSIIASIEGKINKCLICDLDNTLWGGVVGDDGWENIQIGHNLGIGKAFTEFQQWIKKLKDRGIILAVCSKNNEDVAKEAFEKNPEMVLKLDDFAVFIANWDNKADNIRRIQKILNIGFDSMVFIDDNPFERNIVRDHLPEVTVPELPEDPADYLEYLYDENLFETASYSTLDSDRTRQYQIEAQRESSKITFTNEDDFLVSLNMKSQVEGFSKFNIPRVAQLSQRSNQFNLRTIRYTENQIAEIENTPEKYKTFSFTLEDRFGDNGLICVVILEKKDAKTLFIDTWFMSCRVLKRGMEDFTINKIVEYAIANGYEKIIGEFIPTAKNKMVEALYPSLGFEEVQSVDTHLFTLDVKSYKPKTNFIIDK